MKRNRLLGSLLMAALLAGSLMPAYGQSIDLRYADMLRNKMASMTAEQKNQYAQVLEVALYNEATIQATINSLGTTFSPAEMASLEKNGITQSFMADSLQTLKTWSAQDRIQLVAYAKSGDVSGIEALNQKNASSTSPAEPATPAQPGTPAVPGTPGTPAVPGGAQTPALPATPGTATTDAKPISGAEADAALDQLLNSPEIQALLGGKPSESPKAGLILSKEEQKQLTRLTVELNGYKQPEELKITSSSFIAKTPKAAASRQQFIELMSSLLVESKTLKSSAASKAKDLPKTAAAAQALNFFIGEGLIKLDAAGKANTNAALSPKVAAGYVSGLFAQMGIVLPTDASKQKQIKDLNTISTADQRAVLQLYAAGLLSLDKNGKINANKVMTQGEMTALMKKVCDYYLKNYKL